MLTSYVYKNIPYREQIFRGEEETKKEVLEA
jgi:hypothetical protein